jgi:hypothetical protein
MSGTRRPPRLLATPMQQLTLWTPALVALALLLGVALLWVRSTRTRSTKPLPSEWALTSRSVFSAEERRVYRQLREALPHHVVLSKLPLVRFCQPTNTREVRYWYELLGASHVTFAICSANGRVLAAIDLDGERANSRRSQQIKQSVLDACRVRYLRCAADELPSVPELQALLPVPVLGARTSQSSSSVNQSRERLANTVASRRQERAHQWQDSTSVVDSRFSNSMLLPLSGPLDDGGGRVVESAPPVLRH